MKYVARSRGVSRLYAHLVLTTKYRKKVISQPILERLGARVKDLCEKWQCELLEFNGEPEHVHILFRYFPQIQLSKFVNNIKSVSSRRIREEFKEKIDKTYWKSVFCNESYSIDSCGDAPLNILKEYVRKQGGCLSNDGASTPII